MEKNGDFWNRVDQFRGDMSVRELSERLGISEKSLQSTRVTKQMPKVKWVYQFAKFFGTSMEFLYTGEKDEWEDNIVFRKMASDQRLMDICEALMKASEVEVEMVQRILNIKKDISNSAGHSIG